MCESVLESLSHLSLRMQMNNFIFVSRKTQVSYFLGSVLMKNRDGLKSKLYVYTYFSNSLKFCFSQSGTQNNSKHVFKLFQICKERQKQQQNKHMLNKIPKSLFSKFAFRLCLLT